MSSIGLFTKFHEVQASLPLSYVCLCGFMHVYLHVCVCICTCQCVHPEIVSLT